MIIIGIGSNLPTEAWGSPRDNCLEAVNRLKRAGVRVENLSPFYESAPVPMSDQPWYVNGVAAVATHETPEGLLQILLNVENKMGRIRGEKNDARIIDLDLLAFNAVELDTESLSLPHPRLSKRAFVLIPLSDITPKWTHPVSGADIGSLIAGLDPEQKIRHLSE